MGRNTAHCARSTPHSKRCGRSVGKASHGAVSYDVWTRTLKIDDIAVESDDPSAITLKAAQFVATGVASPAPGRFAADRIEITDGELAGLQLGQGGATHHLSNPENIHREFFRARPR